MQLGPPELLIILVIVVLIFGVGKLGDVGSTLGKSIKEFRKASADEDPDKTKPNENTDAGKPAA